MTLQIPTVKIVNASMEGKTPPITLLVSRFVETESFLPVNNAILFLRRSTATQIARLETGTHAMSPLEKLQSALVFAKTA